MKGNINHTNSVIFSNKMYKYNNLINMMIVIIDSVKKYQNHDDWFQQIIDKFIAELFFDIEIESINNMPLMNRNQWHAIGAYIFALEQLKFKPGTYPVGLWNSNGFKPSPDVSENCLMLMNDDYLIKENFIDLILQRLVIENKINQRFNIDRYYHLVSTVDETYTLTISEHDIPIITYLDKTINELLNIVLITKECF